MYTKDYYRIIGLAADASQQEIKRAYRKLAMQYHPDRNKDDPQALERLKELNDAYHVLGNKERKTAYDLLYRPQMGDDQFKGIDSIHADLRPGGHVFSPRHYDASGRPSCRWRGSGGRRCGRRRRKL